MLCVQVHLGEGIAVCEEQLRAVKWSDYRKLTRGLAAILFSPTELATCSVTGQRWSRAGTATERPVKPALDKAKVQAIICKYPMKFQSALHIKQKRSLSNRTDRFYSSPPSLSLSKTDFCALETKFTLLLQLM